MNGAQINQKVLYGYAKAAEHLGTPFLLYRSATPINPISSGNLIGTILANVNVSWDYMKNNVYGNAIFNILVDCQFANDPNSAQDNDYLVGTSDPSTGLPTNLHTYFIQAIDVDLPIKAVECNHTISIIRPAQSTGAGNLGYVGYTPSTSTTIMSNMPASVLIGGRGGNAKTKLPTDTRNPTWQVLLPNLGNVNIKVGDIIIDEVNQNYVVMDNEETELGWRLRAEQVVNNG